MLGRMQVGIGSRDSGMWSREQIRDGLRKHEIGIEIGVMGVAAVPSPPTRIEGELSEVGQPLSDQRCVDAGGSAAFEHTKLVEIRWRRAVRDEVRIQKREMCDLVVGVVMNVLRKVGVKVLQLGSIELVSRSSRNFTIWDAAEFVVLHPEIAFENFRCRSESQQGRVTC